MALAIEIEAEVYEPRPYQAPYSGKRICVVDTETDPFAPARIPKPFSVGFYDGETYVDFWGDDCVEQFFVYLNARTRRGEQLLIYAHNGGGFDFHFFLPWMNERQLPVIIAGRIIKAFFSGQEFRDSYKILPAPLSKYKKDDIDYALFERDVRETHRTQILDYQKGDCVYLHELITAFLKTFGEKLTIGQAAIDVLTSITGYAKLSERQDKIFRNWYFGGRTQVFEAGILVPREGKRFQVYDVNSMYPYVMSAFKHPIGNPSLLDQKITDDTCFAKVELSVNDGALPRKTEDGDLDFTGGPGTYFATIHELRAAEELGLIKIKKVISSIHFAEQASFGEFVERFYELRLQAKARDDAAYTLIYKLLLNNAYGKFAQDGSNYKEWFIEGDEGEDRIPPGFAEDVYSADENPGGWRVHSCPYGRNIWQRANRRIWQSYRNVRIAASITGAARSVLLHGLSKADRPIYCDTDSIICEGLDLETDPGRLGAWKAEGAGDRMAIAGKKLYALFERGDVVSGELPWKPFKSASKGVRLSAEQIVQVASGKTVEHASEVPTFRLGEETQFIARKISRTDKDILRFGQRKRVRW